MPVRGPSRGNPHVKYESVERVIRGLPCRVCGASGRHARVHVSMQITAPVAARERQRRGRPRDAMSCKKCMQVRGETVPTFQGVLYEDAHFIVVHKGTRRRHVAHHESAPYP
eukprot:scaffold931_cov383-Prasinococcus_capsulatus_cf.AAC.9